MTSYSIPSTLFQSCQYDKQAFLGGYQLRMHSRVICSKRHAHVESNEGDLVTESVENRKNGLGEFAVGKNSFEFRRRLLLGAAFAFPFAFKSSALDVTDDKQENSKKLVAGEDVSKPETVKPEPAKPEIAKPVIGNVEKNKGSRIYDSTVLGEPVAVVNNRERVWQKLLSSRVVYLGEAENISDPDDKLLEMEILSTLCERCYKNQRPVTLALEAYPCVLQAELNRYLDKGLNDEELKAISNWPDARWQQFEPLLHYCRDNGVRLMACGAPPKVLRKVQTEGIQGLSAADRKRFVPSAGLWPGKSSQFSLFENVISKATGPFGPGPYRFAQARVVEDYTMSQVVMQAIADSSTAGLVIVIAGASHIQYGVKGSGLPARVFRRLLQKTQSVILLNPEKQHIRMEGESPQADFLWYSSAKVCIRNCFDRVEVARVMNASGRRREALPQDIQAALDRGIISPELLQSFFDLEQQPLLAELTKRFQGLRERWLADPRFLQRLAIEEAISITTTLIAQYERRKDRFWKELDYVITDTVRGSVVDFFTVWLPAPRLAFRPIETDTNITKGALEGIKGFLVSVPDNAFQRAHAGEYWDFNVRFAAVIIGGIKLFCVGFVSSVGTLSLTNLWLGLRERLNPSAADKKMNKRSPIFKTAVVYSSFLGLSANLRYQAVAGIVEHWFADYFLASQPIAGNVLSFVARTANSYWGTQQWVDLARFAGLQAHADEDEDEAVNAPYVTVTDEAIDMQNDRSTS